MVRRSSSELRKELPRATDYGPSGRRAETLTSISDRSLNDIAQNVQTHLHASAVAIAIEFEGKMTCRARAGRSAPEIGTAVQRDRGITGECVRTGDVIRCDDTRCDPRIADPSLCEELGIRSILLVP